jgi:hypothetical protein
MCRAIVALIVAALALSGLPVQAQTSATKPTCAAGDVVVWENTSSKAYHLPGDKYYGKTKHGAYACRSAADTAGFHLAGAKGKAVTPPAESPAAAESPAPMTSSTPAAKGRHHHHKSGAATPSPAAT